MEDKEVETRFPIKIVRWSNEYTDSQDQFLTPVLLQDKNGPCPLIALINTLILNKELQLNNYVMNDQVIPEVEQQKFNRIDELQQNLYKWNNQDGYVKLSDILEELGDMILFYSQFKPLKYEIDQLLSKLPILNTGLNVNPNLISGNFQGDDLGSILFNLFDLKFRHGWTVNQIESESYNDGDQVDNYAKVVELLYELQTFDSIQDYLLLPDETPEIASNKRLIEKWLDLNRTQLTKNGLNRLNMDVSNGEFIVFFRNNHFSTLFKKNHQEFYLLITDSSFQNVSNRIVWQSLNSISGKDDLFFSGTFFPILDIDQDFQETNIDPDNDLMLIKQLQEEEDSKLAAAMQAKYNKPVVSNSNQNGPSELDRSDNSKPRMKTNSLLKRKTKDVDPSASGKKNSESKSKLEKCTIV